MIGCDNDLCPIEWFHLNCVQLSCKPPRGKWYCPKCRGNKQTVKKPKAQFLKELAIFNKEREAKKAKSKKEVNNSKKDDTEDEKTKVQPKILNFFKSKTSLEVKSEPSSDEIIEKENNENVANEIDQNRSRRSSNMSPTKKSPAKTTKNCSKRKRGKENLLRIFFMSTHLLNEDFEQTK